MTKVQDQSSGRRTASRFDGVARWLEEHPWCLAIVPIALLPLTLLGDGTDIDVANVHAAADSIRDGSYQFSRPPGSLPHELITTATDLFGGSVLLNLLTLAAASVLLAHLVMVLRAAGAKHAVLAAFAFAANPFFLIAATSLADHLWALGFLVVGVRMDQSGRRTAAGVLFGLAVGTRASTALLVLGWLFATRRPGRGRVIAIAVLTAGLCFLPAYLSVDRIGDLLHNESSYTTVFSLIGRWLTKQVIFVGVPALLVLIAAGVSMARNGTRSALRNPLVRFAAIGLVASELVFARYPWKLAHLLPSLLCVVIILTLVAKRPAPWLAVLVVAQLLWGVVGLRVVAPDVPNAASGGRFEPAIVAGPLVNDIRCRLDLPDTPRHDPAAAQRRAEEGWACTNAWWRAGDESTP